MNNNASDSLIRGMNFIDHQNMHKAISRRLIVLYGLAYGFFSLLPALVVGLLLAMILPSVTSSGQSNESAMFIGGTVGMFTLLILLLFSWSRSRQLRDGGKLLLADASNTRQQRTPQSPAKAPAQAAANQLARDPQALSEALSRLPPCAHHRRR